MYQFFVTEAKYKAFKESTLSLAVCALLNTLKTEHTHFEVKWDKPTEYAYPRYTISLNGAILYTIVHRPDLIRIDINYNGTDTIEFGDLYKVNEIGFIRYVDNLNTFSTVIDNKIDYMNKRMMYVYAEHAVREYYEPRGKLSVNYDSNKGTSIGFGLTIDTDLVDSRFNVVYRNECEVHEKEDLPSDATPEMVREIIELVISRAKTKINALYARYQNMKETIGGVMINLDNRNILCHRGFKPLITGGFITYKCPYTMSMISLKSSKYDCVIVTGLDEIYGNEDSIVLIGNNY